jgi:hypothetical protein
VRLRVYGTTDDVSQDCNVHYKPFRIGARMVKKRRAAHVAG